MLPFFSALLVSVAGLQFAEGATVSEGSCTFENNTCAYKSAFAFLPWVVNIEGHYISLDTNHGVQGQRALLVSPDLQPDEWSCLRLVYQITGSELSPKPSMLNVFVQPESESFDYMLWSSQEQSDGWLIASVDLRNTSKRYKIILEGILGGDDNSSIALYELKMTTGYCIECDFEENHLCGYLNNWNPNVNWFVGGGNIRNTQAIMPKDHTVKSELGHYMYVDSVYAKQFQEVAQLVSPLIITPISGCLSFYYRIQRESSNVFMVYTRDLHGSYEEIWKMDDVRQGEWNLAEVNLNALFPVEVVFEVAFNGIQAGYVAVDDISFSSEFCNGERETVFNAHEAGCDFENDLCKFHLDNKDGWSRVKVKPNIYRMGDHTTGLGSFMLANSRFTSQTGYMGRLYGPSLPGNMQYCLRFFYTLYGFSKMSDSLAVYLFEENHVVQEKIWSVREAPKGVWQQAEISLNKPMTCQVVFVSWCKSFWDCGLAALDDVTVSIGNCHVAGRMPPLPGRCNFEKDDCGFQQEWQRRGIWHRRRWETPTSYTGPKGDHTSGVGYYMYIEATNMVYGQKARLISRPLRAIHGKQCFIFFYHMYGAGTGILNIYLREEVGRYKDTLLWTRRGEQSISWLRAQIEYDSNKQHWIVFEAIRGISIRSDIAVDDITFQNGSCKDSDDSGTLQSSGYSDEMNEIDF
ncbi:PREDICTED: MAM domain-containing protein 2 isoform X1 [Nanorana parkeri]|uniref:MAM domain-containing protein 2 isoform X1 n=1 Tax=Nanorana parkeri TaxID=125878 RepID=UPI000854F893|nr:PREDICTED: MAM domain-containing protein 2 isoform X1 [Nanorana parkeri]